MAINLTDSLNAATTKGKLGEAKQIFLNGDTKNLQQAHEDTNKHLDTLDNRSTQMENAIKDISVTGGASVASAVSYDNSASKLEAVTAQGALDELDTLLSSAEFKGMATPTTNPGTPDRPAYYIATTPGTYSNFGDISIDNNGIVILNYNNGSWESLKLSECLQVPGISKTATMSQNAINNMNLNDFILKSVRVTNGEVVEEEVTDRALVKEDGSIFSSTSTSFNTWKVHEIHTTSNIYFIEFTAKPQISPYVNVAIYKESDNSVVAVYNLYGKVVIRLNPYFYAKITTSNNHTIIGSTTIIQNSIALNTLETTSNEHDSLLYLNKNKVDFYKNVRPTENIVSVDDFNPGYYAASGKLITDLTNYKHSSKIIIDSNYIYYANTIINGSVPLCVFFNSSDEYIGYYELGANGETKRYTKFPIIIPENASYMYINATAIDSTFYPITVEYVNKNKGYQESELSLLTESYHFFRPNLVDLVDPIKIEDYEVGVLSAITGNINSSYTNYRTYTIYNEDTSNRFLFIKAKVSDNIPNTFCSVMLLEEGSNKILSYYRLRGTIILAIQKGYYAKVCQSSNYGVQTSYNVVDICDTINGINKNIELIKVLDNYQWVRTGIDLAGNILDITEYEVGALTPKGTINSIHTNYRTYTIYNEDTSNRFLFIRAQLSGNLPPSYCTVAILSETDDTVVFHARLHGTQIITIQKGYYAKVCQSSNYGVQTSYSYKDNVFRPLVLDTYWEGKKGAWYGTSIPAQGYPINCGTYLQMTMYNEAQGASMCRAGKKDHTPDDPLGDVYGVTGVAWQNICYSLSLSQEEKYNIFINWTTERRKANLKLEGYDDEQLTDIVGFANLMGGSFYEDDSTITLPSSKPIDIMSDNYIDFRKKCYADSWNNSTDIESGFGEIKGRVQKYLDWDNTVDLWVLDHGHNDNLSSDSYVDITTVPDDPYDRWTFLGAMNFIIKQIYNFNPRARIVIIGHYENSNRYKRICEAQEILAAYWDIPIYKCWDNLQMAKDRVITTNAYWDTSGVWHDSGFDGTNAYTGWRDDSIPENPRQENGVWVHDMSMLRVWMKDSLHPGNSRAKDYYGRLCALFIKNNV